MEDVPPEFDVENVRSLSTPDAQMYRSEVTSPEPMSSVLANNPEIYFVPPKRSAEWGQWEFKPGSYYDTTTGSKHPDWKDTELPSPTRDIDQLRRDFVEWGYCKGDGAIAPDQIAILHESKTQASCRAGPSSNSSSARHWGLVGFARR